MSKAILFLYEGETEGEFFPELLKSKIKVRSIPFKAKCLKGNFNINSKVANSIDDFLEKNDISSLSVFVALDRDGKKPKLPPINVELIKSQFGKSLKEINLVIATQVFESWLFIEINNVYGYLRTPKSKRKPDNYKVYENFTDEHLSKVFKDSGKYYQKGRRVDGLINAINLDNIYSTCEDLKEQIDKMVEICGKA